MFDPTCDDLTGDLRTAVARIAANEPPDEALERALTRAEHAPVAPAPETRGRGRPRSGQRRLGWKFAAGLTGAAWVSAAGVLAMQDNGEWARRAQVRNNMKQIGLAIHNYREESQHFPESVVLADGTVRYDFDGAAADWGVNAGYINGLDESTRSIAENNEQVRSRYTTFLTEAAKSKPKLTTGADSSVEKQRVIHTAEMSLVAKNVLDLERDLRQLVEKFHGYTAEAHVNEPQGEMRSARWIVRIPVQEFPAFLEAAAKLGVPEYRRAGAQDMTEEYVDVKARIATQKKLEQRLLDLLEQREGKLEDVIAVEKQLNEIRGQIEQSEGRQKYLEHQTDLATAVILAREERQYVSPQSRTIGAEIGLAWSQSVDGLRQFGKWLVLTAVAAGPWLPLVIAGLLVLVRGFKRLRRGRTVNSAP